MIELLQEHLSNAEVAFSAEKYDVALRWFEKAISEDSKCVAAYAGAGKSCLVLNELEKSREFYKKAVELDFLSSDRYFDLGNIEFGIGNYITALHHYSEAVRLDCASEEIKQKLYYQMGVICYITRDLEAALLNLEKAEKAVPILNPDTKEILSQRVQIHFELGNFLESEKLSIQYKLLAPQDFHGYQMYFQSLIALEKYQKAEETLSEAENFVNSDSVEDKADICFSKVMLFTVKADNDAQNAKSHYQSALELLEVFADENKNAHSEITNDIIFSRAEIYLKLEDFEKAIECVKSIDADGDADIEEKADFIKLSCYVGEGQYENAVELAGLLKQSENEYYQYFANYADSFATKEISKKDKSQEENARLKYETAIAFFRRKVFENPQDVFALVFRIRLYAENRKYDKASELIGLLPESTGAELEKYISDCWNESEEV